eukprot:6200751-Pleurochrysis_carterae.AAC.1
MSLPCRVCAAAFFFSRLSTSTRRSSVSTLTRTSWTLSLTSSSGASTAPWCTQGTTERAKAAATTSPSPLTPPHCHRRRAFLRILDALTP